MTLRPDEVFMQSGDARICAEAFGRPDDPAILLVGGAATSMDFWEDEFCARLVSAGRCVLRYDHRDTGRSTSYPAGAPAYTSTELRADALAVLDGFGVAAAHLVGISMGGAIAQILALDHPERIASLVLLSTTPAVAGSRPRPELPPMDARLATAFADADPGPDWTDRDAAIEAIDAGERLFAGEELFDPQRMRSIAARAVDRTTDMAAMQTNHWILEGGEPTRRRLEEIAAPTLILHGTEDPLFPYAHGEALAREIGGARLVPLPGTGHQYPPEPLWDLVTDEIIAHTAH